LVECHDVLLKFILDVLNVATKCARCVNTLPGFDFEFSIIPELRDVFSELVLELELLIS